MNFGALYSTFETYPSGKGSSVHILHMINAMAGILSPVTVCCLDGGDEAPERSDARYLRFNEKEPNYLERARRFSIWLSRILRESSSFEIAQFRDIWSGLPIIESRKAWFTVFEVNGLPSIELPYRYPDLSRETMRKIRSIEIHCLVEADMIICPSAVIRQCIQSFGIPADKIRVLPNGAEIPETLASPSPVSGKYIIYFGALQKWQGLDVLIRSFRFLKDYHDLKLVICSSLQDKYDVPYLELVEKYSLAGRVAWFHRVDKNMLNSLIRGSLFTVAPLKDTARNIIQGCSPLKIFESMANAKATLASDIPAVREIITDGFDGFLVQPDRVGPLARAMRKMIDFPSRTESAGLHAQETVRKKYLWDHIERGLKELYLSNMIFTAN
ncbi:MAG TPA: glycosyltransferase family 4 protein [Cyclobacteriaceae bacterium]|nr:glycosyltransferase family 4 protein [Cyclobacteriaceae bacterium]